MKLIKESDIDYILAPIAPVLKGEKVHYEWVAFRKQIDELQDVSPLANCSVFRYVFADGTFIELCDVGLSEEAKEKLEEIYGEAKVEKINLSAPDKTMLMICLRCQRPIILPTSTVKDLSYIHYSYCEDCLRNGLRLLKAQDEAQASEKSCETCKYYGVFSLDCARCDDNVTNYIPKYAEKQTDAGSAVIPSKDIPMKVKIEKWMPTECPAGCGQVLSKHHGDGYFTIERKPKRCPECGQLLNWGE